MPESPDDPSGGPEDALAAAFRDCPVERCAPGCAFAREGEPARDVLRVEAGVARLQRRLRDGRRAVDGFLFPGDVVGLARVETWGFTGEAVLHLAVRRMPQARLYALAASDRALQARIVGGLQEEIASAGTQAFVSLARAPAERLAHFVLGLCARQGVALRPGAIVPVPMPRADVADHLGIGLETLGRALAMLAQEGVVRLAEPASLVVLDPESLRRRGGLDAPPQVSRQARLSGPGLRLPAGRLH
ncbi:helix-turn-helix domain-containing protein [Salinarimonas rosea]|uniref:helix-turn-helix domain-containing protein n=1 Tax=Salinarimonas rosea TaxID=552063 RepID=UPI0004211074|nr:helix-turn-helix domain-containing protein [Salinarimonas rosea]